MIWRIVLTLMFGGQHLEFVGAAHFDSRAECNEQAMKFTALPITAPFAITCVSEVRA